MRASKLSLAVATVSLMACSDTPLITANNQSTTANNETPATQNAIVYWNGVARSLVARNGSSSLAAMRGYALVALSQHNAAAVVSDQNVHAAVSAAAVATLTYLYPNEQAALDSLLQLFLANTGVEGANVGRSIAARIVAYAQTDRFSAPWQGTVPTGPGMWFSSTPPVGATIGQAKTFFLLANNQFRPVPHPAFGSPEFLEGLAEVRRIAATRTQEQDSIAKFWALPVGTYGAPGYWNDEASRLTTKFRLSERRAAHLLALMHMTAYDALVASHEAKYTYWLLRPTMADPSITLAIGLPNFPSYPSNHSTISAAMAAVLGAELPAERARLSRLADQAAISRVYGGIHYGFDCTAGLALGRRVAAWALDHDVALRQQFPLK